MATIFYPSIDFLPIDNTLGNQFNYLLADRQRASSLFTNQQLSVAGGTWIAANTFATRPLEPFTLSGSVSFNFWGSESNAQANASIGLRIYKWNKTTLQSALLGQANSTVEFGTAAAVRTGSVTPTSTAFLSGDCLVFAVGFINIGTMGGNRNLFFTYGGQTANANGDSFITITENVIFKHRIRIFG